MRKSTVSATEIEEANLAEDKRKQQRKTGFSLMDIRDRGWQRLKSGAVMLWPVEEAKRKDGEVYQEVPPGHFMLVIEGKNHVFDADEFQKYVRWV